MKRPCAGYSLLELMIGVAVVLGLMAGVTALAVSARADSRQQGLTQSVLAVASAAVAQAEFDGLRADSGSAELLASRSREIAPMLSSDKTYFDAGFGVKITPYGSTIQISGLSQDQCVEASRAVIVAVPGISGVRINKPTGAFAVDSIAVVAACKLATPALVRVYL